jgi:hypothetical protein
MKRHRDGALKHRAKQRTYQLDVRGCLMYHEVVCPDDEEVVE